MFVSPLSAAGEVVRLAVSVTAQTVADIVKERPAKARGPRIDRTHLKIFLDQSRTTGVTLNSKNV